MFFTLFLHYIPLSIFNVSYFNFHNKENWDFSVFWCFSVFVFQYLYVCTLVASVLACCCLRTSEKRETPTLRMRHWRNIYRYLLAIFLIIYRGITPFSKKTDKRIDLNSSFSILRENAAWYFVWAWHWPWYWFFSLEEFTVALTVVF